MVALPAVVVGAPWYVVPDYAALATGYTMNQLRGAHFS